MNDSDCRARPGYECECCSCVAAARDTDPCPPPATDQLCAAARIVYDAWIASSCEPCSLHAFISDVLYR